MTRTEQQLQKRPAEGEETDVDVQAICDVIGDERNLTLIRTLGRSDAAMTAGDLAEAADIPESTVYRKMDAVCETPIVRRAVALSEDGPQASVYSVVADTVTLSFAGDGLDADLTERAPDGGA